MSAIKRFSGGTASLDYLLTELGDILITQDGVSILVEQSNLSTVPDPFEGESYYLTQDGDILTDQQGQAIGKQVSL